MFPRIVLFYLTLSSDRSGWEDNNKMDQIKRMKWTVHVAHIEQDRKVYKVFVGKPEVKGPLERPRRR
jgi:hypothetical protein